MVLTEYTMSLIAVTVLTGFLGSGKSTLLRRVLTETHGRKIAVIENEFGEESIDNEIIVPGGDEQIIIMKNGCVCCSIREDLRVTLLDLSERKNSGNIDFQHVIIETTGLADPGPIIQTFLLDDVVASKYCLDSVLTMVDAKHAMGQLDTRIEARRQVGYADKLFISKADLVEHNTISTLSGRLYRINTRAPHSLVPFGEVALTEFFDVGGFNMCDDLGACTTAGSHLIMSMSKGHNHDDVQSFVFRSERPMNEARFIRFMNALVNSYGSRLLRYKGIMNIEGRPWKAIIQGVHQLMNCDVGPCWTNSDTRTSKLVFIGIGLPREIILKSLHKCLAF